MTGEYEDLEAVNDIGGAPEWVGGKGKGGEDGEEEANAHCPVPRRRTNKMEGGRIDTLPWGR